MAHDQRAKKVVGFGQDSLQCFFDVVVFIGKRHHADDRTLPGILKIQFRNGYIKMRSQAIFQAAQNLPLVLERVRLRNMQFQGEQSNGHDRPFSGPGKPEPLHDSYLRADAVPWAAASAAETLITWKRSEER